MRRVLAILGAVGMITAAVVIRHQLDENDGKGHERADDKLVIVCAKDLQTYCEDLGDDVTIVPETAAVTADALVTGTLGEEVDGWVTTSAWLEVTATAAGDSPTADLEVLATTPVAASAAESATGDAAVEVCRGQRLWACLGEHAGEPWATLGQPALSGDLKVGITDADTAIGLSVLASVGGGLHGDLDFATNDFTADFSSQLAALKEPSKGTDADPLTHMVTAAGSYAVASSTTAQQKLTTRPIQPLDLDPAVTATVVMVRIPGGDDLPSVDGARAALKADGWKPAEGDAVAPTLKPGVMSALHQLWKES